MFVINYKNYFYLFSGVLLVISIAAFFLFGFKPSLEFTGGSLLEIEYAGKVPSIQGIAQALSQSSSKDVAALKNITIQQTNPHTFLLRFGNVDEKTHQDIVQSLPGANERQFQAIGPVIGSELKQKTILGLILAVLGMFLYVAIAFRKVPARVRSWRMSLAAIGALIHDVVITAGGFAIIAHYYGYDAGTLFIAAELTIWGYSINDTIVVFDRIRENLLREGKKELALIAGESINQTLTRSINTSFAVVLLLVVLLLLGPDQLLPFVSPLLVGVIIGTYSSICIATPLLLERFKVLT